MTQAIDRVTTAWANVALATAPSVWGVEDACEPRNPAWTDVLDEAAAIGFRGIELGPFGYFPEDPDRVRAELQRRDLVLASGFVMQPFHQAEHRRTVLEVANRTCAILSRAGAHHLILIEALLPERAATAGRSAAAARLDETGWATLLATVEAVARVASDHGLIVAFHPHAGTCIEFGDEIDRLLASTDPTLVGLCVDTGHAAYAGLEPSSLLRRHADRLRYVHLKDVRAEILHQALAAEMSFADAVAAGVFCRLGSGSIDFAAIRDALAAADFDGWATFEQDREPGDPLVRVDAEASLEHLRRSNIGGATDVRP